MRNPGTAPSDKPLLLVLYWIEDIYLDWENNETPLDIDCS